MITLTTQITNPLDIAKLVKWEAVDVQDNDESSPPNVSVALRMYGPQSSQYGAVRMIYAFDTQASQCLRVNATPQNYDDLVKSVGVVCSGAYTALSSAWNGNTSGTGTKKKRLAAVEALLVSTGLLGSEFAGT